MSLIWWACSSRVSGCRVTWSLARRPSSAVSRTTPGSRGASSVRRVSTSRMRPRSWWASSDSSSRVDRSAQCRSSITSTSGWSRLIESNSEQQAWNSRPTLPAVASGASPAGASAGTSRASSSDAGPPHACTASAPARVTRSRRSSATGAYGKISSPSATQRPTRTCASCSRTWSRNSSTTRLFPIPAGPSTRTVPARSASRACAKARSRRARASCRPIRIRLVARAGPGSMEVIALDYGAVEGSAQPTRLLAQ